MAKLTIRNFRRFHETLKKPLGFRKRDYCCLADLLEPDELDPEPVFITKNGQGDLAVMSIETYELLAGKLELYRLLDEGLEADKAGKTRPMAAAFADARAQQEF
ncbi:MAG: type II toxin-antitoxin system prevent-host-death family antitoxin [Rectinemataceae bacterium]